MIIRHYTPEDDKAVTEIFREANLPDEHMKHREYESFTIEDDGEVIGIITITEQHGYPLLWHVCVRKDRRNLKMARMAINFFKYYGLSRGFIKGIISTRKEDKGRTRKIISYLFRCEPYSNDINSDWFFVTLLGGKNDRKIS